MPIEILAFLIDDENRDKFAHHGLSADQILQVLDDRFVTYRNRRGRRASHVVLGRDYGGACIAIAVEPTDDLTCWRPVTGWPCKRSERTLLTRSFRRR